MANFIYNEAKRAMMESEIDLASDDIRVMLVMTNTTADTEDDANVIDDFTTLDEYDGGGYSRQELASQAVNEDAGNNRAEFDATNSTFSNVAVGTRQAQAAILFKHVTDDSDSVPIAYIDDGGFPFTGNGSDVILQWNAEGILQQA